MATTMLAIFRPLYEECGFCDHSELPGRLMAMIYWASPLFTEAQRNFNQRWADALRQNGYNVFLPQDLAENDSAYSLAPEQIFYLDTAALMRCDAVVAVIDDETIDCGVAAEMGIAHAAGIPVVAVYTDIRRNRPQGKMYKNLYVIGLAELSLGIVHTQADLIERLQKLNPTRGQSAPSGSKRTDDSGTVVDWLEAHSVPGWSAHKSVIALAKRTDATSIVDFGCGTGRLAAEIMDSEISLKYFGFDIDPQRIEIARSRHGWARFEHDIGEFVWRIREEVDSNSSIVNFSFVLHDMEDLSSARTLIDALQRPKILIQDLTSSDLPCVLSWLCQASGRVPNNFRDHRMSFGRLSQIASTLRITLESLEIVRLRITFDDPEDVMGYCDHFGLFVGWDMPITPFSIPQHLRASLERVLDTVVFPHIDTRVYVIGVASKAGLA